jgi:transposase
LSTILRPWYEHIREQALRSGVLHGDETGWRESGKTRWLWAFATVDATFYMIDRSRSASALKKFFCEEFAGTLVTDFWGPYNAVVCSRRQVCLVHLLRDLKHVEQYKQPSRHWPPFAKKLRRLLGDAMRLKKNDELADECYASRRTRIDARLDELILAPWEDSQARRLIKRLRRHRDDLFTFLDHDDVPFDNNHAERSIRPAVVMRKNQYGNRSPSGAETQALLMSVYRTLQQRSHDPLTIITNAIVNYLQTGHLPNMPPKLAPSE